MSRERSVMWAPWTDVGLEHLSLSWDEEDIRADGVVIGAEGGVPFRARYEIRCDRGWRLRELAIFSLAREGPSIELLTNGKGKLDHARRSARPGPRRLRRRGHLGDAVY